jgi:uncharacterized membrane protein YbhN (UPF0104 family)
MATLQKRYAALPQRTLQIVFAATAAALLAWAALRSRSVVPSLGQLRHPDVTWLVVAVLAQAASLGAYALIVRELLRVGAVAGRVAALLRTTLGGIAMGSSLPGGQVASAAYWYKQLRREGAGTRLSAFAMVGSMLAGLLSLVVLFVVGIAVAGDDGPFAAARTSVVEIAAALLLVAVVFRSYAGRTFGRIVRRLVPGLPAGYAPERRNLAAVAALAFANWLLDLACLWAALAAMHASVPAHSVLVTYALARLVGSLPLLPGGGGTVEASLVLTFATFQHASASVVAGVLLYRVISCWGLIPVGWLAVIVDRRPRFRTAPLPQLA